MFSGNLKRSTFPRCFRPSLGAKYSTVSLTLPKGLQEILEKRPEDVVITFAKRTAMSRAKKGQLNNVPVDKLLHSLFRVMLGVCSVRSPMNLIYFIGNPRSNSPRPFKYR